MFRLNKKTGAGVPPPPPRVNGISPSVRSIHKRTPGQNGRTPAPPVPAAHAPSLNAPHEKGLRHPLSRLSQGRNEGRNEGQLRAMRSAILRTLELKHDPLPQSIASTIASTIDEPSLLRLLDRAVLSSSLAQFAQDL